MWGRVVEIMTAVWLGLSPWIFQAADQSWLVIADLGLALSICVLAGLSFWPRMQYAHLGTVLVAIAMVGWGRFAQSPPPVYHENHIVIGLFLLMMAIVPNEASMPPAGWREDSASADPLKTQNP